MRIAAIYDIHGNLPALESVLSEIELLDVDQVLVGGDVLPGPMPRECLDAIRNLRLPVSCIRGNGERNVLAMLDGAAIDSNAEAARDALHWVSQQLNEDDVHWIRSWPLTAILTSDCGNVLFCHATPENDFEIFTADTPEHVLQPIFGNLDTTRVVCGHTHIPFERTIGDACVFNAGSVGMPFGSTKANWLLIDEELRLRTTEYDLERSAERIRNTDYPQADAYANNHVLNSPSASDMIAIFEKSAIGRQSQSE